MRITADLVATASREFAMNDTGAAVYHLLLAVVGALDADVNVTDAIRNAVEREKRT